MKRLTSILTMSLLAAVVGTTWGARTTGYEVIGEELVTPGYEIVACRAECVDYVYHKHGSKCKFDRCDMHEVIVMVRDECTKCCVEVPVCVPCCCTQICDIDCHPGLFGRCVYEYCWDCGFRMEIIATKHGEFIVHYYGVK